MKEKKTNAMRILDQKKIAYHEHTYDASDGNIDGMHVAQKVGLDAARVFKTLVTKGNDANHYVFVIPVDCELNLKAAAKAVGVKSVEMIAVKDLLQTTGYIRGGCSPIGMKKQFLTVIDESAQSFPTIYISAGKIGQQIEINIDDLCKAINAKIDALVRN